MVGFDSTLESFTGGTSEFGAGTTRILLVLDDCRECAGGVGGSRGTPILFEVCFNIRGFGFSEFCAGVDSASALLSRDLNVCDWDDVSEGRTSFG